MFFLRANQQLEVVVKDKERGILTLQIPPKSIHSLLYK